jgi:hypothetical protein
MIAECIETAIAKAADGEEDFRVNVQNANNSAQWLQISWDLFNASYPHELNPVALFSQLEIELPEFVQIEEWSPNEFVTFSHGAHSISVLSSFLESYLLKVMGANSLSGWGVET